jgi:hypothetical protein
MLWSEIVKRIVASLFLGLAVAVGASIIVERCLDLSTAYTYLAFGVVFATSYELAANVILRKR